MVHKTIINTPVSCRFLGNGRKPENPRFLTALYIRAGNGKSVNGQEAAKRGCSPNYKPIKLNKRNHYLGVRR